MFVYLAVSVLGFSFVGFLFTRRRGSRARVSQCLAGTSAAARCSASGVQPDSKAHSCSTDIRQTTIG